MYKNKTQNLEPIFNTNASDLQEYVADIVFEKKNDSDIDVAYNLEEQLVLFSNKILGVKVQSVALPNNFTNEPKTEAQLLNWLRNKINNRHSSAYVLALKYGEKLKVKLPPDSKYTLSNLDNDKYRNFSVAKSR
jgi:hypothetical protein